MADSIDKLLNAKGNRRGMHPNSLKNLENGRQCWHNPMGRPKKDICLTSLIKEYLEEVPDIKIGGKPNTKTWRELIAQAWLVGAYKGNATLFKELLERIEGKVALPITGDQGEPLIPPPVVRFHLPDGTVIKPPRNGHKSVEALANGDSHKAT